MPSLSSPAVLSSGALTTSKQTLQVHSAIGVYYALDIVSTEAFRFIGNVLSRRGDNYKDTSLVFTDELVSIANMRVCPGDSTFCSSLFVLVKEYHDADV